MSFKAISGCTAQANCKHSKQGSGVESPKPARGFRYRRSTVTKAPRKRTFIANMQKYVIDRALPAGPATAVSGILPCLGVKGECCGFTAPKAAAALPGFKQSMMTSNDNGGNGRSGSGSSTGFGDDSNFGSSGNASSLHPLALAAAIAVCTFLCSGSAPAFADMVTKGQPAAVSKVDGLSLCLNSNRPKRAKGTKAPPPDAIVYGRVELTGRERGMMVRGFRQLQCREMVRV